MQQVESIDSAAASSVLPKKSQAEGTDLLNGWFLIAKKSYIPAEFVTCRLAVTHRLAVGARAVYSQGYIVKSVFLTVVIYQGEVHLSSLQPFESTPRSQ